MLTDDVGATDEHKLKILGTQDNNGTTPLHIRADSKKDQLTRIFRSLSCDEARLRALKIQNATGSYVATRLTRKAACRQIVIDTFDTLDAKGIAQTLMTPVPTTILFAQQHPPSPRFLPLTTGAQAAALARGVTSTARVRTRVRPVVSDTDTDTGTAAATDATSSSTSVPARTRIKVRPEADGGAGPSSRVRAPQ